MFELIMFWIWVTVISYLYIAPLVVWSVMLLWKVCAHQLEKTILPVESIYKMEQLVYKLLGCVYPVKSYNAPLNDRDVARIKVLRNKGYNNRTCSQDRELKMLESGSKVSRSWGSVTGGFAIGIPIVALLLLGSCILELGARGMPIDTGMLVYTTTEISTFLAKYTSWLAPLVVLIIGAKLLLIKTVNFFVNASKKLAKIDKFIVEKESKEF